MKIVVLDGYTLNPGDLSWEVLEKLGSLKVYDRTPNNDKAIIKNIADADVVFTNKTPLPLAVLNKVPQVKFIGVLATGYNIVDVETAKQLGMVVSNVPSYSTASVAQLTFALLLEMCHHVGDHAEAVAKGDWTKNPNFSFWNSPLIELAGKTMGIIGFGNIGQAVAKIAQAFGLKVIVYGGKTDPTSIHFDFKKVSLDELLATSDVISLHCPLTESTKNIINQASIAKMKASVKIINTSRGCLINELDLAHALNEGKVAGAALDVVSVEPILGDNPLLNAKNCIITPHIAWAPLAARTRLLNTAIANLKAFKDGAPVNVVNN